MVLHQCGRCRASRRASRRRSCRSGRSCCDRCGRGCRGRCRCSRRRRNRCCGSCGGRRGRSRRSSRCWSRARRSRWSRSDRASRCVARFKVGFDTDVHLTCADCRLCRGLRTGTTENRVSYPRAGVSVGLRYFLNQTIAIFRESVTSVCTSEKEVSIAGSAGDSRPRDGRAGRAILRRWPGCECTAIRAFVAEQIP
jgi:hypothetical protein